MECVITLVEFKILLKGVRDSFTETELKNKICSIKTFKNKFIYLSLNLDKTTFLSKAKLSESTVLGEVFVELNDLIKTFKYFNENNKTIINLSLFSEIINGQKLESLSFLAESNKIEPNLFDETEIFNETEIFEERIIIRKKINFLNFNKNECIFKFKKNVFLNTFKNIKQIKKIYLNTDIVNICNENDICSISIGNEECLLKMTIENELERKKIINKFNLFIPKKYLNYVYKLIDKSYKKEMDSIEFYTNSSKIGVKFSSYFFIFDLSCLDSFVNINIDILIKSIRIEQLNEINFEQKELLNKLILSKQNFKKTIENDKQTIKNFTFDLKENFKIKGEILLNFLNKKNESFKFYNFNEKAIILKNNNLIFLQTGQIN